MKHKDYQDTARLLSDPKTSGEEQLECFQILESAILEGESPNALEAVDCLHLLFAETRERDGFSSKIKEILERGAKEAKTEEMKDACDYVLQDIEGNLVYVGDLEDVLEKETSETEGTSSPEERSKPALPPVLPDLGEPESIRPQPLPFSSVVPTRLLFGLTVAAVLLSLISFMGFVSLRKELIAVKAQSASLGKELAAVEAQSTSLGKELAAVKNRLVVSGYKILLAGFKKKLEEKKTRKSAPRPCPQKNRRHCFPPYNG